MVGHMTDTPRDPAGVAAKAPLVLVVDDDEKLARIVTRYLERHGCACTTAASGDGALWALNRLTPAALVLDVMIPHPSGLEVCRHVRAIGYQGIIVMMSARSGPADEQAAMRAGASVFLGKPFPLSALGSAIEPLMCGTL